MDIEKESQDLFDSEIRPGPILPELPLSIPGSRLDNQENTDNTESILPKDYIYGLKNNPLGNTLLTHGNPVITNIPNKPSKPGWWEQAGHALWKMNRLTQAGEFIYDSLTENKATDMVPEGWTAMTPESVEGYPEKYFDYLTDAKTPNDLLARQQKVRERVEEEERFTNGSLTAELLGGFVGIVADPTTYLIPMAAGLKYESIAQNLFLNMGKVSSGMAIDSLSRNMLINANEAGSTLQDVATDSLRDFIYGTALVGAGSAISRGLSSAHLWNNRRIMNMTADGLKVDFTTELVNGKSVITGMEAKAIPGENLSADVIDAANLYLHEEMSMKGVFAVPFIGKPLKNFLGWGFLASPALKAFNSAYPEVRSFFNRITNTGIITKGEEMGEARIDSASDFAQYYRDHAKSISNFIRSKYLEANGLTGGANTINALKNFKQTFSNNQTITLQQFGEEVRRVAYEEGYQSKHSQANEVAAVAIKFFENIGADYHRAVGQGGEFLNPRTAWKYLPQNYNIQAMLNKPEKWLNATISELSKQDGLITSLQQPIRDVENNILQIKEQIKDNPKNKSLKNSLKTAEMQLFKHQNELIERLRNDEDLGILLEDRIMFDESERAELNNTLDPVREAERQKVIVEARLRPLLEEKKNNKKDTRLNVKIKTVQEQLRLAEEEITNQKEILERRARDGEIDRKYFYEEGENIKFYEPNRKPNFRKVFSSPREMQLYAQQAYDSILNQSPESLVQSVLGTRSSGIIESPSVLKQRSILINSQAYNEIGMLDPDISKSITSYANTMGKIIGFKRAFPEFADQKGFEGVLRKFKETHDARKNKVLEKEDSPKRKKELNKINKEYENAKKFMNDTYKVYMGNYSEIDPELNRLVSSMKNLVVSAKLGAVPIYQIAELGAIVIKGGLMPFFAQGLRPMIKSLNGSLKGKEGEAMRMNAANCHLALYNVRNGYAESLVNSRSMSSPPHRGWNQTIGVATDNLAHMSGNLYGTNFIANINESIAANLFQSEVMQAMFAHEAGTLSKTLNNKMLHYGIDVSKWSKRFIKGYKDSGGWEVSGGHQSQYYKWVDLEASSRMAMSMRRMVHDTVVNKNAFTSPYWTNNPFLSMIFMFHGWAYGALTHYSIPMMQRPDAENMMGLLAVVSLSMLAEPLKRMANGLDPYDEDTSWFDEAYKAVDYSGVLGPYASYLQDINNMFGGSLIPHLQSEKYANRYGAGQWLGPVAGYGGDIINTLTHGYKGDYTATDLKRAERLLPFSSHVAIRGTVNKFFDSLDLPKNRQSSHPWSFRENIYGQEK